MEFSELFLYLEDEWWKSHCPHVQHSLSNPDIIKMTISWTMLELEGHVDLTIKKQLSKQTRQGRCQEEGVPARVAEVQPL